MKKLGVTEKYLEHYAEQEVHLLTCFPDIAYENALVIPAYSESTEFVERLKAKSLGKNFLLVLVSNHPENLSEKLVQLARHCHQGLIEFLTPAIWRNNHLSLHQQDYFDVLLVNRTASRSLPENQAVGLARKIGSDIALALHNTNKIASNHFMCSDADALLPEDYFDFSLKANESAAVFPFEHIIKDDRISQATELYEASINHYVDGLSHAHSPYAFHTIGSLLAINFSAYAQVRGFPKKAGGEDFYLLNKLAKVGLIQLPEKPLILLKSRSSNRVPFGTGPAVERLVQAKDMYSEPLFYHPAIFEKLSKLLESLKVSSTEELRANMENLPEETKESLSMLGIENMYRAAEKQSHEGEKLQKHIQDWFDAFRTLKYVHILRDNFFPSLSHKQLKDITKR